MKGKVQKWGNSLALRIPASFAKEISLFEGGSVDLSVKNGGLFLLPVKKPRKKYSLSSLLDGISEKNLHSEIDTGDCQGAEIW